MYKIGNLIFFALLIFFISLKLLASDIDNKVNESMNNDSNIREAIFAGGCFWQLEYVFEKLPGVIDVVSGYAGGTLKNPTYALVSTGNTGYYESILVRYNRSQISYERLLEIFWENIDPTEPITYNNGYGSQYRTAIFYTDNYEKQLAEESRSRVEKANIFGKPIQTKILKQDKFYPAEKYHQNYYEKHPMLIPQAGKSGVCFYDLVWKKNKSFRLFPDRRYYWIGYRPPEKAYLKRVLTPVQYRVTQENGTEAPFNNEYWNNHKQGIYVDIVSGEPLFSSTDKFDSGTGWPIFTKPLEPYNVVHKDLAKSDVGFAEVRSRFSDSHLGHVFREETSTGFRYCINSAALKFIPVEELDRYGYGEYKKLF